MGWSRISEIIAGAVRLNPKHKFYVAHVLVEGPDKALILKEDGICRVYPAFKSLMVERLLEAPEGDEFLYRATYLRMTYEELLALSSYPESEFSPNWKVLK